MLIIYFSFPQLWATFATKLMKRPAIFYIFFNVHFVFTFLQNFMISKFKKKCHLLEYVNKILLISATLNNIFDKNCEKSFNFCNVFFKFLSLFTLSRSFIMILWYFIMITYSCFNVANKMLLISKIIFFTPCFQNFLLSTIYFSRYLQFPLNTITYQENYVTEGFLLEDYGTWNWNFFIFAVFVFSTLDAFPKKTYEKTYCFYNIFSKFTLNCTRLATFTVWIYFFRKSVDWFNLMSIFLTLNHFSRKHYEKIYHFYDIFWKFLSFCTCLRTLALWNILQKMLLLFENVSKLLLISTSLSIVCHKTY